MECIKAGSSRNIKIIKMPIIKLDDVWKIYQMGKVEVPALRGVNFDVNKGEYVSITGQSGSGKSTMLNILGCLSSPTRGKVYIDGIDTTTMSDNELARIRREKIGFVFQQFNLLRDLTAEENVALPMRFNKVSKRDAIKRARELLDLVGLGKRKTHRPTELSGGEQQRVAIARALVNDPEVILADEPTGNLDTASGENVVEVLEKLHGTGKTLVVITHEAYLAERAERGVSLMDGKIV